MVVLEVENQDWFRHYWMVWLSNIKHDRW